MTDNNWQVHLNLENTGSVPILDVFVRSHSRTNRVFSGLVDPTTSSFGLRPGARAVQSYVFGASPRMRRPSRWPFTRKSPTVDDHLFIFFTDAKGRRWMRDVRSNRYVSRVRRLFLEAAMNRRDASNKRSVERRLKRTLKEEYDTEFRFL
jgi:hypothetical protein